MTVRRQQAAGQHGQQSSLPPCTCFPLAPHPCRITQEDIAFPPPPPTDDRAALQAAGVVSLPAPEASAADSTTGASAAAASTPAGPSSKPAAQAQQQGQKAVVRIPRPAMLPPVAPPTPMRGAVAGKVLRSGGPAIGGPGATALATQTVAGL